MKYYHLLFILPLNLFGQSNMHIQLNGQTTLLNGSTHSINLTPSSPELINESIVQVKFRITNQTGVDQQCTITQKRIVRPTNWIESLEWNFCFLPNLDLFESHNSLSNPAPVIINGTSQMNNGLEAILTTNISVYASPTNYAHYRYYITDATTHEFIDSVDLEINSTLGIANESFSSLTIYPNPINELLHIEFDGIIDDTIIFYNLEGKVVSKKTNNKNSIIDIQELEDGIYIVEFKLPNNGIVRKRIVIKH